MTQFIGIAHYFVVFTHRAEHMSFSFDASMCRNNIAVEIYAIYVKKKKGFFYMLWDWFIVIVNKTESSYCQMAIIFTTLLSLGNGAA